MRLRWEKKEDTLVPFELASLISIKSTYQDGGKKSSAAGKEGVDYEIVDVEIRKYLTETNSQLRYITTDNEILVISHFELARKLFFHNQHLARMTIMPNGLNDLATCYDDNTLIIKFPKNTNYPVSNLKTKNAKRHLAWLLYDQGARKSIDSIYTWYLNVDKSRLANFTFKPIHINGWKLTVRGRYLKERHSSYFGVYEILEITDNSFSLTKPIKVEHPKDNPPITQKKSKGKSITILSNDENENPNLDLAGNVGFGTRTYTVNSHNYKHDYANDIEVIPSDSKDPNSVQVLPPDKDAQNSSASTGLPLIEGENLLFNHGINRNEDDPETEAKRFDVFRDAISPLRKKGYYHVSRFEVNPFPETVTNSRAIFRTIDGTQLKYISVGIKYKDLQIIILEADNQNLTDSRRVSTLVFAYYNNYSLAINKILQAFTDNTAKWDRIVNSQNALVEYCGHPKKLSYSDEAYAPTWGEILDEHIQRLYENWFSSKSW